MARLKLKVEGMSCGGCANAVEAAAKAQAGVTAAHADHRAGTAEIEAESGVSAAAIAAAITAAGYPAQPTGGAG